MSKYYAAAVSNEIANQLSLPIIMSKTTTKAASPKKKAKSVAKMTTSHKSKGRPQSTGPRPFICPVAGCGKSYPSSGGLHQHKRAKHPELITPRGSNGSGAYRKHACPVEGCDKSYDTSGGLYQHKNAKHPELIRRR